MFTRGLWAGNKYDEIASLQRERNRSIEGNNQGIRTPTRTGHVCQRELFVHCVGRVATGKNGASPLPPRTSAIRRELQSAVLQRAGMCRG